MQTPLSTSQDGRQWRHKEAIVSGTTNFSSAEKRLSFPDQSPGDENNVHLRYMSNTSHVVQSEIM